MYWFCRTYRELVENGCQLSLNFNADLFWTLPRCWMNGCSCFQMENANERGAKISVQKAVDENVEDDAD